MNVTHVMIRPYFFVMVNKEGLYGYPTSAWYSISVSFNRVVISPGKPWNWTVIPHRLFYEVCQIREFSEVLPVKAST